MPTKTPTARRTARTPNTERILRVIRSAREQRRNALLETESMELVRELGLRSPGRVFVNGSQDAALGRRSLPGDKVVVKVVSADILHKSDVGGVAIVENSPRAAAAAILKMEKAFRDKDVTGYTLNECVSYDRSLGGELLLGMRWAEDCGPIVTFGAGGIYTEFLASGLRPEKAVAILSAELCGARDIEAELRRTAVFELLAGGLRGQAARVDPASLVDTIRRFATLARALMPEHVSEFEVNPLVVCEGSLVALDARTILGRGPGAVPESRPLAKIKNLLEARSAALVGVSEKMNVGHVILNNMIKEGFPRERIYVVKPGSETLEGCRCVPDVPALPERVDMAVVSVPAANVSEVATSFIESAKAESLIVIPGGLEEKSGSSGIVSGMHAALAKARKSPWRGPVINGGNCLGIRSVPAKYDTMFIPDHKKSATPRKGYDRLALVSQSGAFAVSKMDKLSSLAPKYSISIGNQTDLTIGDYLTYLKDDPEIEVFAVYVEGFKPLDCLRFLRAARDIRRGGRSVVLYRAGRTSEGQKASASHTASIAQDYSVTRALARQAGVVVAETLSDFEDLVRLFVLLKDKKPGGRGLGAVSNAGFECVAIADNLGALRLPDFSKPTTARLQQVFSRCRIAEIVDVHNPLDLTPMAGDEAYEDSVRAVLEDPGVDIGVIGCVPLTPALGTLPAGDAHREDIRSPDSIASRLLKLGRGCAKPWVAVIDSGWLYDPMARLLEEGGVPVFRSEDTALRLLNVWAEARQRR